MTRILGIATTMLFGLLLLVPAVAAAEPGDRDDHIIFNSSGDITIPAGQSVDMLVVFNGTATIEGDAGSVVVINGTANFVGATTQGIAAIRSRVTLDGTSVVSGDVRTLDSTVERASGAVVSGTERDLGPELANAALLIGLIGFLAYLAFAITGIFAGLALAALASRQVREAGALISREPLMTIVAAFVGLIAIVIVGVLAIVTVVGAPLGLGLLVFVLPLMFVVGYLVMGIWIGDQILDRTSPGVVRDRPYLAAVVGLIVMGIVGIIPVVGGLVVLVGFGAVVLLMWRVFRRDPAATPASAQT